MIIGQTSKGTIVALDRVLRFPMSRLNHISRNLWLRLGVLPNRNSCLLTVYTPVIGCATAAVETGFPVAAVKVQLGWRSEASMRVYAMSDVTSGLRVSGAVGL